MVSTLPRVYSAERNDIGMKRYLWLLTVLLAMPGCVKVKTDPIKVEPIEITMNVNLRVTQALDDFFGDLDAESQVMEAPAEPTQNP